MESTLPLESQVIVIIGGTTGLGLSAARACLASGAAGVVVTGRNPESAQAAREVLGSRAETLIGDAIDGSHAETAIALAVERFRRFDALYHVAGGSGRSDSTAINRAS